MISNLIELLNLNLPNIIKHESFINIEGQIENIEGFVCLKYKKLGMSFDFSFDKLKITSIHLECIETWSYYYVLPGNMQFSLSKHDVNNKLGNPNKVNNNLVVPVLGKMPESDIYYFANYSLAIIYSEDLKSIQRLTIMTPEDTPGRNK